MSKDRAERAHYHALTTGYALPKERAMLNNVLADMRRGNISHVLVRERRGVAVWRTRRIAASHSRSEPRASVWSAVSSSTAFPRAPRPQKPARKKGKS